MNVFSLTLRSRVFRSDYPESPLTVGEHLKKARLDRGIRQKAAARSLGCRPATLGTWEKGRVAPDIRFWPAIPLVPRLRPVLVEVPAREGGRGLREEPERGRRPALPHMGRRSAMRRNSARRCSARLEAHGVGLCQVGAYGMAQRGHTYREIIYHYYRA